MTHDNSMATSNECNHMTSYVCNHVTSTQELKKSANMPLNNNLDMQNIVIQIIPVSLMTVDTGERQSGREPEMTVILG